MERDYEIRDANFMDIISALRIAARQADADGMPKTAQREQYLAAHLLNAEAWSRAACPPGYRPMFSMTFSFQPDVNPVLREDLRADYYEAKIAAERAETYLGEGR